MNTSNDTREFASDATGAQLPGALSAGFAAERLALWNVERDLWAPLTHAVREGSDAVAAALTAGRPHTAYRKIVDVVARDAAGFRAAVEAVLASVTGDDSTLVGDDSRPTPIVVKFEEHPNIAPLSAEHEAALVTLGFAREADPLPSVPSTRPDDTNFTRGWVKWLGQAPTRLAPYYGQTTDVTCGAVSALMALEAEGLDKWGSDGAKNHSQELDFWRRATNLPACEPIGLAVATANEITASGVGLGKPRVILSIDGPILLEDFADDALEVHLRTQLQEESLSQAEALGLPIERRWVSVEEIRDHVSAGADVFLLIALEPLIGDSSPHWVLAHDVISHDVNGDSLIISDPWVEATHGESWVDTSALPIPLAGIDLITRWGEPAYRGVVVVPRGQA